MATLRDPPYWISSLLEHNRKDHGHEKHTRGNNTKSKLESKTEPSKATQFNIHNTTYTTQHKNVLAGNGILGKFFCGQCISYQ